MTFDVTHIMFSHCCAIW